MNTSSHYDDDDWRVCVSCRQDAGERRGISIGATPVIDLTQPMEEGELEALLDQALAVAY